MYGIVVFEDKGWQGLRPLTWTRPSYLLRCGADLLIDKAERAFEGMPIGFSARLHLIDWLIEEYGDERVNPQTADDCLYINGRVLWTSALAKAAAGGDQTNLFVQGETLLAFRGDASLFAELSSAGFSTDSWPEREMISLNASLIEHPWDLVYLNPSEISSDIASRQTDVSTGDVHSQTAILGEHPVLVESDARVDPFTVLDARDGPILIQSSAHVMSHCLIEGPCAIGPHSKVKAGARVYSGTSCGEWCKIGGEIEQSVMQAFSNKQHEGFLGHACLGAWVNIAAATNNSDLRNDYGIVSCVIDGESVSTGKQFFGAAVGDHAKTGIEAMFNTGSLAGAFCNLFGIGYNPREIPCFSWGGYDGWVEYRFDKAIETADRMMQRRQRSMTPGLKSLYRSVFDQTGAARDRFFLRAAGR